MGKVTIGSFKARLAVLVLIAFAPAAGLMVYFSAEQHRLGEAGVFHDALVLARLMEANHRGLVEGARQLLQALAEIPEVKKLDSLACDRIFARLKAQSPVYANIGAVDAKGNVFASAVPVTGPLNLADRRYFQDAVKHRHFVIGEYIVSRAFSRPTINFAYPVLDDGGQVRAVLVAALNLTYLSQLLGKIPAPKEAEILLTDHQGTILARHPDPEEWTGKKPAQADLLKAIQEKREGTLTLADQDGRLRLYAFTALDMGQHQETARLILSLPTAVAFAGTSRHLTYSLAALGLIAALTLLGSWLAAKYLFLDRINRLLAATRKIAQGDLDVVTGLAHDKTELGVLAAAFDQMAESLRIRARELGESEARYRSLFADNRCPMLLLDPETGRIVEANPAATDFYGYSRAELIDLPVMAINHRSPEEASAILADVAAGRRRTILHRHILKNGHPRDVEIYSGPIQVAGQELLYYIIHDITARRRAEAALARRSRTLKTMSECNQALVRAKDEPELLRQICQIAHQHSGYPLVWVGFAQDDPEKTVSVVASAGEHPDYAAGLKLTWAETDLGRGPTGRAIRSGEPCLVKDIATDPHYLPWREPMLGYGYCSSVALPLFLEGGRVFGVLKIYAPEKDAFDEDELSLLQELAADLSYGIQALRTREELVRTVEALRTSEENFRQLTENISEIFVLRDLNTDRLLYCSPAYEEVWGRPVAELYQNPTAFLEAVHPEDRERIARLYEKGENFFQDEHRIINPQGETRWIFVRGFPIFDQAGAPYRLALVVEDITERKNSQEERQKLEVRLRQAQKMEAIGTLAGGIAHDFNNILGAIMGYTEMALLDSPPEADWRSHLDQVLKASFRAKDLVKRILAFSRQAEDQAPKPIKLAPVLAESLNLLRASLPATIEMISDLDEDAGPVMADPTQVQQVLMNLCTNAAHAMRAKGGRLEVSLRRVDPVPDPALGLGPGPHARLSVRDTGEGIDPAILDRIFEPYFTTKDQGEGTGLGLAVVHGIVRSHKGEVVVESRPGQGTVFHVYLPILGSDGTGGAVSSPLLAQGQGPARGRIMFVDDETALADLGRTALARLGYQVTAFTDSRQALDEFAARPDRFDLLVTDLTMPGLTGLDLAQAILSLRPDLPVIVCSGFDNSLDPDRWRQAGVRAFCRKPLSLRDLDEVIRQCLGGDTPVPARPSPPEPA